MSGSIGTGIDYVSLFSSNLSSSDIAGNLLTILYSGNATSGSTVSDPKTAVPSTGNPVTDLQLAKANQTKDEAAEAQAPAVVQALSLFKQAVAHAPNIQSALENPDVLNVLLTANGLGDQTQYPALAAKILLSNPSDSSSLVNQVTDTRWLPVVKALNLGTNGLASLNSAATQSQLATQYASVSWLNALNQTTPGLAQALEFQQQASSITGVDQILGDPTNRTVVLGALGIPQQVAFQPLQAQEQAVTTRLDLTKLKDPKFVTALTDQFLLAQQQSASSSTTTPSLDALAIQAQGLLV